MQQLRGNRRPFSITWFGLIVRQWNDWNNGIPPSREWLGRAGQNAYLLDAFAALDRAKARFEENRRDEIARQAKRR